ncbi:hypothetical protein IT568_10605 [bacterium]|nr:hypothetical protein [bacterium]
MGIKKEIPLLVFTVLTFVIPFSFIPNELYNFCWLEIFWLFAIFTSFALNIFNKIWFKEPLYAVEQLIFIPVTLVGFAFGGMVLFFVASYFYVTKHFPPMPVEVFWGILIFEILTLKLQAKIIKKIGLFETLTMSFSSLSLLAVCFDHKMVLSAFENFNFMIFILACLFSLFVLCVSRLKWNFVNFIFWLLTVSLTLFTFKGI